MVHGRGVILKKAAICSQQHCDQFGPLLTQTGQTPGEAFLTRKSQACAGKEKLKLYTKCQQPFSFSGRQDSRPKETLTSILLEDRRSTFIHVSCRNFDVAPPCRRQGVVQFLMGLVPDCNLIGTKLVIKKYTENNTNEAGGI